MEPDNRYGFPTGVSNILADASFAKLVGATTREEQAAVYFFAKNLYSGQGSVVEHGSWLGSLTRNLIRGLKESEAEVHGAKIHAYDLFRWEPYMEEWAASLRNEYELKEGDDFRPLFFKQIAKEGEGAADAVVARAADLSVDQWTEGPIEFLLNDAWKMEQIAENIIRSVFPCLFPEVGWVAHQDFLWPSESFIQVYTYRMRHKLEMVYHVPRSTMVIFRLRAAITEEEAIAFATPIRPGEIGEAFAWSKKLFDEEMAPWIDLAHAWMLARVGESLEAEGVVARISESPHRFNAMYAFMEQVLHASGGPLAEMLANQKWPFLRAPEGDIYFWFPPTGVLWTTPAAFPAFHSFKLGRELTFRGAEGGVVKFSDGEETLSFPVTR